MKMHMTEIITAMFISVLAANSACEERSGLIAGIGTSLTPLVHTSEAGAVTQTFTNRGPKMGISLCMGYAMNHRRVIVLMVDAVFPEDPEVLGFVGPMYFYYFQKGDHSVYLVGGLGLQLSAWPTSGSAWSINIAKFGSGTGVRGGIGYEIAPHIHCDFLASIGKTSRYSSSYTHTQISLNLRFPTY